MSAVTPRLECPNWRVAPCRVFDVHPELAFGAMRSTVIAPSKKSREGATLRAQTLIDHGIAIPTDVKRSDDLLEACAVARSTRRLARGEGVRLPDPPPMVRGHAQAV